MPDNAKIALYEHVPERVVEGKRQPGQTKRIGLRELDQPLAELVRRRGWKGRIVAMFQAEGWSVDTVSVAVNTIMGEHLVAYLVRPDATVSPARRRPVTRGGRPISGPDLSQPSMAARLRKGR
jgi:hypothetical protein